jgi:hypothetical protein
MENNIEKIKTLLFDIQDYQLLVSSIVKALSNIEYRLEKLKTLDIDYKDLPTTREHIERSYKSCLKTDFKYMELTAQKDYIDSIGVLWSLFNALKEQYEKEVLQETESN